MNKKRLITAVICVSLLLSALAGCGSKAPEKEEEVTGEASKAEFVRYTEEPNSVKKTETVYVNLDNAGGVRSTVVSDWLHTDKGCVRVKDRSGLNDIVNIKSEAEPEKDGENLIWHMDSTDLYYRGTTDKKTPISLSIKYLLDGKEITAEKLAGKSGEVEIRIDAVNNEYRTVTIDGKEEKIYSPFILVGGMILPEGKFSGITVENGRAIGDGSKEIVAFAGAPGLSDSLSLDSEEMESLGLTLADSFSVKAQVDSFSLGNIYFAALPLSSIIENFEIPASLDEFRSTLEKISEIQNSLKNVDIEKLLTFFAQGNKAEELTGLLTDAVNIYNDNKALLEILPKYLTEDNVQALSKLLDTLNTSNIEEVTEILNRPVMKAFISNLPELVQSISDVMPLVEQLQKDMNDPEIQACMDRLPETLTKLGKIQATLNENQELLDMLSEILTEENIKQIGSLLEDIDEDKAAETAKALETVTGSADVILSRATQLLSPESDYTIFTLVEEGTDSSVMFVYQTPGIE